MALPDGQIEGLHRLQGYTPDQVVVLGFDLDADLASQPFFEAYPGAHVVSLSAGTKNPWAALQRVLRHRPRAIVAAQPFAKLELLALAIPARTHLVLRQGQLVPIAAPDAAARLPAVRRLVARTQRALNHPRVPPPRGPGNDFSFLAKRCPTGPVTSWARIRASVIVPVYNRKAVLEKTLVGLARQSYPSHLFDVIIADDGSADHPESLAPEFPELSIQVVRQADQGYRLAEVRNLAIRAAQGEVIVSLDCDMLPEVDFLASHLRWFHAGPEPVCVIGYRRFVNTDEVSAQALRDDVELIRRLPAQPAPSAIQLSSDPTKDWREPVFEQTQHLRTHRSPYTLASGGNVAFRRADAVAAGLYYDGYQRWGGEDSDFGYQLERLGCYFVAEPGALAYHQDHPESAVREEDRVYTRQILGSRVPALRAYAPTVMPEHHRPLITVIMIGSDPETLASVQRQRQADFELLQEPDGANHDLSEALDQAQGEMLIILRAGDQLRPKAFGEFASTLRTRSEVALIYPGPWSGYSSLSHLRGHLHPYPMACRLRDARRALYDHFGPVTELELSLRLSEVGQVAVAPPEVLIARASRRVSQPDLQRLSAASLARRALPWRLDAEGRLHSSQPGAELLLKARQSISELGR